MTDPNYAATLRRRSIKVGVAIAVIQNIKTRRLEQTMPLLEMPGVHHRQRLQKLVGTPLLTPRGVAMDGTHLHLLEEMPLLIRGLIQLLELETQKMTVESQLQTMKAARGRNSKTRRMKER